MYDDTPPRLSNQYYNPFYPFPTKTNRSDLQFQTVDVFLITLKNFITRINHKLKLDLNQTSSELQSLVSHDIRHFSERRKCCVRSCVSIIRPQVTEHTDILRDCFSGGFLSVTIYQEPRMGWRERSDPVHRPEEEVGEVSLSVGHLHPVLQFHPVTGEQRHHQ